MITTEQYKNISSKYGYVASWAVWEKAGAKPKSNIGNMDVLDLEKNSKVIELLNTNVVMVGLNFSRDVKFDKPFMNFHDSNPSGNDFKIRFAFEDTAYYGAYMTDVIKNLPMVSSKDVLDYLKENPDEKKNQINDFREELRHIGSIRPTIIAFGKDVYDILRNSLETNEYKNLFQITHYSHQISKEKYRKETHQKLNIFPSFSKFCEDSEMEIVKIADTISHFKSQSQDDLFVVQKLKEAIKELLIKIDGLNVPNN